MSLSTPAANDDAGTVLAYFDVVVLNEVVAGLTVTGSLVQPLLDPVLLPSPP